MTFWFDSSSLHLPICEKKILVGQFFPATMVGLIEIFFHESQNKINGKLTENGLRWPGPRIFGGLHLQIEDVERRASEVRPKSDVGKSTENRILGRERDRVNKIRGEAGSSSGWWMRRLFIWVSFWFMSPWFDVYKVNVNNISRLDIFRCNRCMQCWFSIPGSFVRLSIKKQNSSSVYAFTVYCF